MDDLAIRVENLSKQYRIGRAQQRHDTLRDALVDTLKRWKVRRRSNEPTGNDTIWALRDVSFEVRRGEVVGIIGRNGAGKSTLLKILSRITDPTSGRAEIHGRVGSLLEVGPGFHPDLTGRENIYLNGAILGMRRHEIERKFDEIVAFAEIEKFLDTPVKRYSSGMYVRLAFAVAAHLEPEILLVDEVLAVGDAAFQKKCLGKMGDVAQEGRTVLFVSHNMAAIESLCNLAMMLNCGRLTAIGSTERVVAEYLLDGGKLGTGEVHLLSHPGRHRGSQIVLREIKLFADGLLSSSVRMGGTFKIVVSFKYDEGISNLRFGIAIENHLGQRLMNFSPSDQCPDLLHGKVHGGTITCEVPALSLTPGLYYITVILGNGVSDLDRIDRAIQFTVEPSDVFGTAYASTPNQGFFYQRAVWNVSGF